MVTRPAVVLFDAVGTLMFPDPPVPEVYAEAGRRAGSSLSVEQIASRFRAAWSSQLAVATDSDLHTSESIERQRWRDLVSEVFDDVEDVTPLFQSLWEHFARPTFWRLFEDVSPVFERLAHAGVPVGIASNFDVRLRRIAAGTPALERCRIFISSEIGYRKPSPRFFADIERALGQKAGDLLLVGDDPAADVRAAREVGWESLLIDRRSRHGFPDSLQSLSDVLGRIGV